MKKGFDFDEEHDYYGDLGLSQQEGGGDGGRMSKVTPEEIRKAYRKLALKYHPDRHVNSTELTRQRAAERFILLNKAYEVLENEELRARLDEVGNNRRKRAAYDERKAREMSAKRTRMTGDLERREQEARDRKRQRGQAASSQASSSRAEEVERLKREGRERRREQGMRSAAREADLEDRFASDRDAELARHRVKEVRSEQKDREIKVRWHRKRGSHSEDTIVRHFRCYGDIYSVEMGRKGNSATVRFTAVESARAAADAHAAMLAEMQQQQQTSAEEQDDPRLMFYKVELVRDKRAVTAAPPKSAWGQASDGSSSRAKQPGSGGGNPSETLAMREMRQAEERERLRRQILLDEEGGAGKGGGAPQPGQTEHAQQRHRPAPAITQAAFEEKERRILQRMAATASGK